MDRLELIAMVTQMKDEFRTSEEIVDAVINAYNPDKRIAELEKWVASAKLLADQTLDDAKASGRTVLRLISTSAAVILKR